MEDLLKSLKVGALWGLASVILQWYLGILEVTKLTLDMQTIIISALTLPALASALIIRGLNEYFVSGLLNNNSIMLAFHTLLSINIGVFIGLFSYLLLYFSSYIGVGKAGSESIELHTISG